MPLVPTGRRRTRNALWDLGHGWWARRQPHSSAAIQGCSVQTFSSLLFAQEPAIQRAGFGQDGCVPAVTRSATALRGSPLVTRPSPTSTASAPAPAYANR